MMPGQTLGQTLGLTLGLTVPERIARARGDLAMGVPVVLTGAGPASVAVAVETLTDLRLAQMRALGPLILALTSRRAETLKARAYDGDLARIAVPEEAGLDWLRAAADPADDLRHPMKGPFLTLRGGDAEGARAALRLCKGARLLPAAVLVTAPEADALAQTAGLTVLAAGDVAAHLTVLSPLADIASARLPTAAFARARIHLFRPGNGTDEHQAIEIGQPDRDRPVLARLHSACFTGDVLGSLRCDCGPQLHAAMAQMGAEGAGVLLYLGQEGRGIGLANKLRAYALQDQGFDTVEANHRLGFEDDERDFRIGAAILREMGFSAVRLMTNNPRKITMMEDCGIRVAERVPLHVGHGAQNAGYLATKAAKSGHLP